MNSTTATAEVFITAFRSLKKREQEVVLRGLIADKELRQDLIDIAILEQRKNEPSRSFSSYLRDRKKRVV